MSARRRREAVFDVAELLPRLEAVPDLTQGDVLLPERCCRVAADAPHPVAYRKRRTNCMTWLNTSRPDTSATVWSAASTM